MTKVKVTTPNDGNGYIATIIEDDGEVVYDSAIVFPQHGIFPEASDAQSHGDAWAARLLELPESTAGHKAHVALMVCEEGVIITAQLREDERGQERAKKSAKGFKDSIDQHRARLEDIQSAPGFAKMKIVWPNRKDPADVKLMAESTLLDDAFEVEVDNDDDPRQMSLPEVNWAFTTEDRSVTRVAGYGRIKMRREGDLLYITLGADEHELVAEMTGPFVHTSGALDQGEEDKAQELEPVVFACGGLKDKPLRVRLGELSRPETIIGIYKLEQGRKKKPRKRMVEALKSAMLDHPTHEEALVMAWTEVDEGRPSQLHIDVAAAALASATGEELEEASDRWIEAAVADCGDPLVLSWLIDGEREREDKARDHVITVATDRRAALGDSDKLPEDFYIDDQADDEGESFVGRHDDGWCGAKRWARGDAVSDCQDEAARREALENTAAVHAIDPDNGHGADGRAQDLH